MVISTIIGNTDVMCVFVDQGSSADILFYDDFKRMDFDDKDLLPYEFDLIGFSGKRSSPKGYIKTRLFLGTPGLEQTISAKFIVIDCPAAYNAILGRPSINLIGAIVSTPHLVLKFLDRHHRVVTVRGDQALARSCLTRASRLGLP